MALWDDDQIIFVIIIILMMMKMVAITKRMIIIVTVAGVSILWTFKKKQRIFKLYSRSLTKTNMGNFEEGQYTLQGVEMITNSRWYDDLPVQDWGYEVGKWANGFRLI